MEIKHEIIPKAHSPAGLNSASICTFYLLEDNHWVAFGNGIINKESGLMRILSCTYTPAKLELEKYVRDYNE